MTGTLTKGTPSAPAPAAGKAAPAMLPFTRASLEHIEQVNLDKTVTLGASAQQIGPVSLPSYGYLRSVVLLVEYSGASGGSPVLAADAPYSVLGEVALQDVNGSYLCQLTGYELYLANKWGAVSPGWRNNPALDGLSAPTTAAGKFLLRIPVELIGRDALGCLPNMNAAAAYQLKVTVADTTGLYATAPNTLPDVRIRAWVECWSYPEATSVTGQPQALQPPAMGTTQYWTRQAGLPVAAGDNLLAVRRVGNLIRNMILVFRDDTGARSDSVILDPVRQEWDARIIADQAALVQRLVTLRRFPQNTLDTGVQVFDLTHGFDQHPGSGELADLWYQTAQSTRLEFRGNAAATGTCTIIVNDVVPNGDVYLP